MRKCSYWFSLLSEKEQKEYKANINVDWDFLKDHQEEDFENFITCGFIWEGTPQGKDYWSKISQRTNHNRGNFLTRLLRGIGLRA
jgi:hypothetical protein